MVEWLNGFIVGARHWFGWMACPS